jgi:hypothetical protein
MFSVFSFSRSCIKAPPVIWCRSFSCDYRPLWEKINVAFSPFLDKRMSESTHLNRQIKRVESSMHQKGYVTFIHAMPAGMKVVNTLRSCFYGVPENRFFKYIREPDNIWRFKDIKTVTGYHRHLLSVSYSMTSGVAGLESAASWGFGNHGKGECYGMVRNVFVDFLKKIEMAPDASQYFLDHGDRLIRRYGRLNVGNFEVIGAHPDLVGKYFFDSSPYNQPTGKDVLSVARYPEKHLDTLKQYKTHMATAILCKELLHPASKIVFVTANDDDEVDAFCDNFERSVTRSDFEKEEQCRREKCNQELDIIAAEFAKILKGEKRKYPSIDNHDVQYHDYPAPPPP